jgi:hypothetical protein
MGIRRGYSADASGNSCGRSCWPATGGVVGGGITTGDRWDPAPGADRVQWRDLPKRFDPWKTMYERHRLWSAEGQFQAVLEKIRVPRTGPGRPRKKPGSLIADKAYSNSPCHTYLRRRGIRHTIPGEDRQPGRLPAKRLTWRKAPASTKSATRNATPSSGRSTSSNSAGPSPPDTTSAATSSSAPQPHQPWSPGSVHDRRTSPSRGDRRRQAGQRPVYGSQPGG